MTRLRRWWRRLLCRLGKCQRCAVYCTAEGIGGRCVACGRIYGWMTRAELSDATARKEQQP